MVHRPLAPLCVDVPEFFPKGPASSTWPVEDQQAAKPLQFYTPASDCNPYQDELFPYKGHVAAARKAVAVYQVNEKSSREDESGRKVWDVREEFRGVL